MRNYLYIAAALTVLLTMAACKSTPKLDETASTESSESMDSPTPEPDVDNSDLAMNDIPTPTETAPSAPVESLGASSSGLGR